MPRAFAVLLLIFAGAAWGGEFDPVLPGRSLEFPRDRGAHPGHRIEWWYVTGQVESPAGPLGFQVTFFRLRNRDAEGTPGRFSPRQLLFAHAALADPRKGRLLHDQRSAREVPPLVEARAGETAVRLDDWSLVREGGAYRARVAAREFALELAFTPTQPVLLQGEGGFSRKGASAKAASYYYSEPHLATHGRILVDGQALEARGVAWLDHEWSSELLVAEAQGWDWLGANLEDGTALMAFRIRSGDGATLWASGTMRPRSGAPRMLSGEAVRFRPRRTWKSPRTDAHYPVAMDVILEGRTWRIDPLMDDQELDARSSTGTIYWEGAVRVTGPSGERGTAYLELTGYAGRLSF